MNPKVDGYGADDALVNLGTPAVEPLIACLKDKNLRVRQSAAAALGKLGDARAVEPLVALLKDDIEKKVIKVDSDGADDALIKLGKPAVEPLIACLKDKNLRVRQTAAVVLAKLGDARGSEVLVSGLNDKNDQVQRDSAQALDELGDSRATEYFANHLDKGQCVWPATYKTPRGQLIRVVTKSSVRIDGSPSKGLTGDLYFLPGHYTLEAVVPYSKVIPGHVHAGDSVPDSSSSYTYETGPFGRGGYRVSHYSHEVYAHDGWGMVYTNGIDVKASREIDLKPSQAGSTVRIDWPE